MRKKIIHFCDRVVEYCLYLLIFCLPFAKAGIQTFSWLAITAWLIKKATDHPSKFKITHTFLKLNKPLLAFFAMCVLSTIMSADFGLSSKALYAKVLKHILLFLIVAETFSNWKRFRNILIVMVASACLVTIDAAVQYLNGYDFLRRFPLNPKGIQACFGNRNSFGGWLIMFIPIILGLSASKQLGSNKVKRIAIGIISLPLLFFLALTYSRASWVGFASSLGFTSFYFIRLLNNWFKVLVIFVILLSFFSLFMILPQDMKDRISSTRYIENSILFRINLWKESFEVIQDFPLFGIGLNTYSKVAPLYNKGEGGYYPHNSYLQMAAEIGIIGFLCFFLFITRLLKLCFSILRKTNDSLTFGLSAAILAFLIHSFFDVNLFALQLAALFWFISGLAVARVNMLTRNRATPI